MEKWMERCASKICTSTAQVQRTVALLRDEATVPFVVRYRQDATGGLDETQVTSVLAAMRENEELEARRQTVMRQCVKMSAGRDILQALEDADDMNVLEDLYMPFKARKSTKAQEAHDRGLGPIADQIWNSHLSDAALERAVATDGATSGVLHLLAQRVSEHPQARASLRAMFIAEARLHVVKLCAEAAARDGANAGSGRSGSRHKESAALNGEADSLDGIDDVAHTMASHRVLKINRAERNKLVRVSVKLPPERAIERLCVCALPQPRTGKRAKLLEAAVTDGYKRLLQPAMARYLRKELTSRAEQAALRSFARNLERLLLQRPLGRVRVLGVDPGYRSGSKLAAVDESGAVIAHALIHALPPHNKKEEAVQALCRLIRTERIQVVAVGNGCGGRELMEIVAHALSSEPSLASVKLCGVSEAGASVLSVSSGTRSGADSTLDVGTLGAASLARRVQDPLAELVKLEPRSIGVGMYQHDICPKLLSAELDLVVQRCVCAVGVDVNTASVALLQRVAGMTAARAEAVIASRPAAGYRSRSELLRVRLIGKKSFEQAAGFIRVVGDVAIEPLDATAVHPESYPVARALLKRLSQPVTSICKADTRQAMRTVLRASTASSAQLHELAAELAVAPATLEQVVEALITDWRDPRDSGEGPLLLGSELRDLTQIRVGQVLHGVVRNVTPFGAFVDVGLKEDGLLHVSELSWQHVSDPHDMVEVGQPVVVKVVSVDIKRQRLGLSLKAMSTSNAWGNSQRQNTNVPPNRRSSGEQPSLDSQAPSASIQSGSGRMQRPDARLDSEPSAPQDTDRSKRKTSSSQPVACKRRAIGRSPRAGSREDPIVVDEAGR